MRLAALLAVPLVAAGLAGSSVIFPLPAVSAPAQRVGNHCRADEAVIYSCRFGKSLGSVCGTAQGVHYRFGPADKPALDIPGKPDWSNVHVGDVRGQGSGGYQEHVRFTNGETHYIVFRGQNGALASDPGHAYSGISVQSGVNGERTLATLGCAGPDDGPYSIVDAVSERAPSDADLAEQAGGPFDGWF